jgi:hypothetical protein
MENVDSSLADKIFAKEIKHDESGAKGFAARAVYQRVHGNLLGWFYLSKDASLARLSRICARVQAANPKINAGLSFA